MAGGVTVVWQGLDDWVFKVITITSSAPEKAQTIMAEIGDEAKDIMDNNTPVRTGKLREGNTLTEIEGGFSLSNATENDQGTVYSPFVEYGTRHMAAQPFLAPAVEFAANAMEERLPEALDV